MTLGRFPLSIFFSRGTPPMSLSPAVTCWNFRSCFRIASIRSRFVLVVSAWYTSQFRNNNFTELCCGTEAGSYLRLIDSCITQLKAQGPSRTCNESKEEEEELEEKGQTQGDLAVVGGWSTLLIRLEKRKLRCLIRIGRIAPTSFQRATKRSQHVATSCCSA